MLLTDSAPWYISITIAIGMYEKVWLDWDAGGNRLYCIVLSCLVLYAAQRMILLLLLPTATPYR
jgi:hypothetical protein